MNSSLLHFAKWICRTVTQNEFDSLMVILLEVQNGSHPEFAFKIEKKSPNYRNFRQEAVSPLREAPDRPVPGLNDWRERLDAYCRNHGRVLRPVTGRAVLRVPEHCRCEACGAPHDYLYLNDGKKATQYRCKVCSHLGAIEKHSRDGLPDLWCPYCSSRLYRWKEHANETIYKCGNNDCSFYREKQASLTPEEKNRRAQNKYDPNFKLRYQYREFHIDRTALKCRRPECPEAGTLASIRKSMHTLGLVLSFFINLGMSSRQTRDALRGLFGIRLSHQTVMNYIRAAAGVLSGWLDSRLPVPGDIAAGDETYIQVKGVWHYTWFVIDCTTRALCGYNISDTRGAGPALATLINTYGQPESAEKGEHIFVRDGLGSYDNAIEAYNQMAFAAKGKDNCMQLKSRTVVGLENLDPVSRHYRNAKQQIERLNRSYKFHTRPRCGFKNLEGATALTTLFVSYYNHLRPHSACRSVPVPLEGLQEVSLFPEQWKKLISLAIR